MSILDKVKKVMTPDKVQKGTQEGEKLADKRTGDKYDDQVSKGGDLLDKEIDERNQQ